MSVTRVEAVPPGKGLRPGEQHTINNSQDLDGRLVKAYRIEISCPP